MQHCQAAALQRATRRFLPQKWALHLHKQRALSARVQTKRATLCQETLPGVRKCTHHHHEYDRLGCLRSWLPDIAICKRLSV
eukprot:1602172-Amphidinium_carterae.1